MNTELNGRIATVVFEYNFEVDQGGYIKWIKDGKIIYRTLPDYSGSISDAWLVVEELEKRGITIYLSSQNIKWNCEFCTWLAGDIDTYGDIEDQSTAPLAICYAALDICAQHEG